MSFGNRGVKRNSFGTARNSFGRPSGGSGGGGSSSGNNIGSSVGQNNRGMNPWESGSMPGRGILPTPNNNLALNSSQAELVIVSNLLNNLIRTQQEPQTQVPSLLSLGTSLNNPLSSFRNQGSFGNAGRFNDRLQRSATNKTQRGQPYNKMGNRARDGVAGRRGPSSAQFRAQSQSGNQRNNGNQNQHRNDKNTKASKKNEMSKKEQLDKKNNEKPITENVVKSDEAEEGADKKRDWKDEKKDGDTIVDKTDNANHKDDKNTANKNDNKNSKKSDDNGGKKTEARHAESRYSAVPISQMVCHVCNKHMWDGSSFENHLRGRAHQLMMEKLDESYKLKVDLMRHELRVSEEQRDMSLKNSKRRGKKIAVDLTVREYCTMCDLNFYGTLTTHRQSDKHQNLKTFLHPRCVPCSKEFPSRIEYDEHCLTPAHMMNTVQIEEQKKSKKQKLAKGESEVWTDEDEEKDTQANETNKTNDKDDEVSTDNNEYLFDITDDMDMKKYKIPSLKYCRQKQIKIGNSMVKEVHGYHCQKCRKFMLTLDDVSLHLKTSTHYKNFIAEVKLLTSVKPVATSETPTPTPTTTTTTTTTIETSSSTTTSAADESTEKNTDVKMNDIADNKEENNQDNNDDYDGNFKRRKVENSDNDKVDDIDDKIDSQMDEIDDIDDDIDDVKINIDDIEKNKIIETNENEKLINDTITDGIEKNGIKELTDEKNSEKDDDDDGDIIMLPVDASDKPAVENKKNENNDTKNAEIVLENINEIIVDKMDGEVIGENDKSIEKTIDNTITEDNKQMVEKTIVPDEIIEKTSFPGKIIEQTIVPGKIVEQTSVPDKIVEQTSVPGKIVEQTIVPDKPTTMSAKIAEEIKKVVDSIPEAPPAPIISSPMNQHHRHSLNNVKNHSPNMHTPNKSPRGGGRGGFRGNRGHQRARRSRR